MAMFMGRNVYRITNDAAAHVLGVAREHCSNNQSRMVSSAQVALRDGEQLFEAGDYTSAALRALTSLFYSIGFFHPQFQRFFNEFVDQRFY